MIMNVEKKKSEVSGATLKATAKKLAKLDKFFGEDAVADIKFTEVRGRHVVEITVKSGAMFFRAESRTGDPVASVDEAVDSIVRQIRKNKTKLEKKLRTDAFERTIAETAAEEAYTMIRRKHFALKPMTEEEAILQMELLNHKFYLFKNADEENLVCVVYSREDGGYGILVSE